MNGKTDMSFINKTFKFIKKNYQGYLYIAPIMLGILLFTLIPMMTSLYYSFFDYNLADKVPQNFGFQNYIKAFTTDFGTVSKSFSVTFIYSIIGIPLSLVMSFALALFLNQKLRGMNFFRVLYYVPVVIPAVVGGLLWSDMTDVNSGIFNIILRGLNLPTYTFYSEPSTVLPTLIFMGFFGLGGGMVLWIAQLKSIPETMYEASKLEGAKWFDNLFKITIPMCTPMIFYNLVLGIIGSLQTFAGVFLLITPANAEALNFFVVYIYNTAFGSQNLAYSCALSWILFVVIGLLTMSVFKTSKWVFYGEEQ